MNLEDYIKLGDTSEGYWELPPNAVLRCTVTDAKSGETKDGDPRWSAQFTVMEAGETEGKTFWLHWNFSGSNAYVSRLATEMFIGLGLDPKALYTKQPDQIAASLIGRSGMVHAKYTEKNGNTYSNHFIKPVAADAPPKPKVADGDNPWDE